MIDTMKKNTKAILIDPFSTSISLISLDKYQDISDIIGCNFFTTVRVNENTIAFCDDEGLINNTKRGTLFKFYPHAIAGKVLLCGSDIEGKTVDVEIGEIDAALLVELYVEFE